MKFATVLTLALSLLLVGACGGDYQAPPKSNSKPVVNNTPATSNPGKQPTGPSMETDYTNAAKAASLNGAQTASPSNQSSMASTWSAGGGR